MKKYILIGVVVCVIILAGVLVAGLFKGEEKGVNTGAAVAIPDKVLNNKFGFLSGGEPENPFVGDAGAAWVRPHPGPFLWDAMQASKDAAINFAQTDKLVKNQQKQNYGTLATLWPFAEWDQAGLARCAVSQQDEFLPQNDKKGRGDYLPLHRCNPNDWSSYAKWVSAVVERYDGDGQKDMSGLKAPIKYWEVMYEPDLASGFEDSRLVFYKDDAVGYAKLLIETAKAIRLADPNAKILIAGAAGADQRFLNFYQAVLSNVGVAQAFDIGNVHCISNERGTHDFNVGAYKKLLQSLGLNKPIWVTEAEAFNGKTAEENYELTKQSVAGAMSLGAERIFFTRFNFDDFRQDMSVKTEPSEQSIKDSQQKYLSITSQH